MYIILYYHCRSLKTREGYTDYYQFSVISEIWEVMAGNAVSQEDVDFEWYQGCIESTQVNVISWSKLSQTFELLLKDGYYGSHNPVHLICDYTRILRYETGRIGRALERYFRTAVERLYKRGLIPNAKLVDSMMNALHTLGIRQEKV